LFKTLHKKKRKNDKIIITDNQGTDAYNIKIAEKKGWIIKTSDEPE
jgi:hypothetical protein